MAELNVQMNVSGMMNVLVEQLAGLDKLAFAIADDAAFSTIHSEQPRSFLPHENDPHEAGAYWFDLTLQVYGPAAEDLARAFDYLTQRGRVKRHPERSHLFMLLEGDGEWRA